MDRDIIKRANRIARQNGYGRATDIVEGSKDRVICHTRYGYRKITNDQYVPHKYLTNFGWKNTYYQPAITVVEVEVARDRSNDLW